VRENFCFHKKAIKFTTRNLFSIEEKTKRPSDAAHTLALNKQEKLF
jgi:hypothetical protein